MVTLCCSPAAFSYLPEWHGAIVMLCCSPAVLQPCCNSYVSKSLLLYISYLLMSYSFIFKYKFRCILVRLYQSLGNFMTNNKQSYKVGGDRKVYVSLYYISYHFLEPDSLKIPCTLHPHLNTDCTWITVLSLMHIYYFQEIRPALDQPLGSLHDSLLKSDTAL